MKYYIIAGEPSGDLHGSNLMKSILKKDPNAEFRFWGGDQMLSVDKSIITHIKETSIMGFSEVVKNLPKILSFFKRAKETISEFQPDKLILIDYSGFNLRIAKWAKQEGHHISYYISPQLWAWKKGRIKTVKSSVDDIIVILPFEQEFYKSNGINAHYVGHPLLPVINDFEVDPNFLSKYNVTKPILAILPGSRKQEISKLLPSYLRAASTFADRYQIIIAGAPNIDKNIYQEHISKTDIEAMVIPNDTYNILSHAEAAIVTSGTATLEAALFEVPQVVCYKTTNLNYQIGKRLVDLKYICLVNLIMNSSIIPELIQSDVNPAFIQASLQGVIDNKHQIISGYQSLKDLLAQDDSASDIAADIITTV